MVIFFDKKYITNYKRFNRHYKKSTVSFHKDYFGMCKQNANLLTIINNN